MADKIKLSFTGDIACDKPLLNAAKIKEEYKFEDAFKYIKSLLQSSDFVIGNLETTFSGSQYGYNSKAYKYNSPDSFLYALKKAGINFVSTANNHCLDGGLEGLIRTIEMLDMVDIGHTGTYINSEDKNNLSIVSFGGIRIAILSYTYGVNEISEKRFKVADHVNLLKPSNRYKTHKGIKKLLHTVLTPDMKRKVWKIIRKAKGTPTLQKSVDNIRDGDIDATYLSHVERDIKHAKTQSDLVIVCSHSGGQFNVTPGEFSQYMVDFFIQNGVDIVIGNHAHIVQRMEVHENGALATYCLGGLSISPSAEYLIHDDLPQYSIVLHVYLSRNKNEILIEFTFSIIKAIEDEKHYLTIWPSDELIKMLYGEEKEQLEKELTIIYNRFSGKEIDNLIIEREYKI